MLGPMRHAFILVGLLVPILLGLVAARDPKPRRGFLWLWLSVVVADTAYAVLLSRIWFRLSD